MLVAPLVEAVSTPLLDGEEEPGTVDGRATQILGEARRAKADGEAVAGEGPLEEAMLIGRGPFDRVEAQVEASRVQSDVGGQIPCLVEDQGGRADPEAERGRWRFRRNPFDDVVDVQQQASRIGRCPLEGEGVYGIVMPVHRIEIGVRPDRLGDRRLGAHAVFSGLVTAAGRPPPTAVVSSGRACPRWSAVWRARS